MIRISSFENDFYWWFDCFVTNCSGIRGSTQIIGGVLSPLLEMTHTRVVPFVQTECLLAVPEALAIQTSSACPWLFWLHWRPDACLSALPAPQFFFISAVKLPVPLKTGKFE